MILSDFDLIQAISDNGSFKIKTKTKGYKIGPSSVDLTLDKTYSIINSSNSSIFIRKETPPVYEIIENENSEEIMVPPKGFILASTEEFIEIDRYHAAYVEGRSSIGRLGLFVQNAGYIDAGFNGKLTLELFNATNMSIMLCPGMRICQIVIFILSSPSIKPYCGKYQGQTIVTPSRINEDE